MDFKIKNISYKGRESFPSRGGSSSSNSSSSNAGGSGGSGGRYIPYSINENGDWVVENGYYLDESGNTVFGADIIVPGNIIAMGESSAYLSGSTSGGTGGSTVEWEQLIQEGTHIANITIDGNEQAVYAPQGGSGGGSYSAGSGISINSSNVIALNSASQNALSSGTSAYSIATAHTANTSIHVTSSQKTTWNNKQDRISDIDTIRANAASGKSAYDSLGNYYTSAQTDSNIYDAIQDITGQLNNNFWDWTPKTAFTSHISDSSIHRTSAQTQTQIDNSLAPYFTSAQTDERYVNVASAQTITGQKTFTAEKTYIGGDLIVSGSILSLKDVSAYGTSSATAAPAISVNPVYSAGTLVATIVIGNTSYPIYIPTSETTTPSPDVTVAP